MQEYDLCTVASSGKGLLVGRLSDENSGPLLDPQCIIADSTR